MMYGDAVFNQKLVSLLLVEDDDIDAMNIERSFKKNKIANPIIRAIDGVEALEMMRNDTVPKPYIVLLDLQMPRMNGVEFLQAIRNDEVLAQTVIFILTTSNDEQDISRSYDFNIAGYYTKSEAGDNFINIVNVLDSYWKVVHLPNKA